MAFRESPVFPDELAYGASGGPTFRTHVVVTRGGQEQRNQCWAQGLRVYTLSLEHRDTETTNLLRRFFRSIALGRRHGFRFRDRLPGEETGTTEVLGTGDGVQTAFPLVKHYTLGGYTHTRTITKPVAGSVTVFLDTVATGAFTVDTTTGVVTLTSAPAIGVVVTASYSLHVPVRFETDRLDITRAGPTSWSWNSIRLYETRAIL